MSVIKAVLDTQIFLRAAINRRSLPARIVFDINSKYQLVVSQAIIDEVRDVLSRPEIRTKFPHLTDELTYQVIEIMSSAEMTVPETVTAVARDPKDDIFLACALTASADYIVSEDQDLLVLNPYQGIEIINVSDFFNKLQEN